MSKTKKDDFSQFNASSTRRLKTKKTDFNTICNDLKAIVKMILSSQLNGPIPIGTGMKKNVIVEVISSSMLV